MVVDFSTSAAQALTASYGHTAQTTWSRVRTFPSGPARVLFTDISIGQITNVGFISYTFNYASYLIGVNRIGYGAGYGIRNITRVNKYWGVQSWVSMGSLPAGDYKLVTQCDYVNTGPDGKNGPFPMPGEVRASFRMIVG